MQPTDKMVNVNECVNTKSVKSNVVCLVKQVGNDDSSELSESDLSSDTSSEKSESRGSDTSNVDGNSENGNNADDEVTLKSECANCSECVKLKNEVLKLLEDKQNLTNKLERFQIENKILANNERHFMNQIESFKKEIS